jgi:signal transduction histidine kinase/AraC-like DNA-binding protein
VAWALALALALGLPGRLSSQLTSPLLGIDHFDVADGLPGMFVADLAQTGDGLLWLQASGFLVSYDGLEFETHDLDRFPGGDGILRAVSPGRADTLWAIVGRKLYSYVAGEARVREEFEEITGNVWQDGEDLWTVDPAGIVRFGASGPQRVARMARGTTLGSAADPQADASNDLRLYVSTPGRVLEIRARVVLDPLPFPEAWPLPDPHGTTWVTRIGAEATELTRLDGTHVATLPRGVGTTPVLLDRRGLLWVRRRGAVTAVGPDGAVVQTFDLAPGALVGPALEDAGGNIWMGTVTDGLYRIRPLPVRSLGAAEGVTDGQVLRVSAGPHSSALAVHNTGGLTRVGDEGAETVAPETARVVGALTDSRGTTWISYRAADGPRLEGRTAGGGAVVIRLPPAQRLTEDPSEPGTLWVTSPGLYRVRPYAPGDPVVEGPLLGPGWGIRDMFVAPDGDVWVTGPGGLAHVSEARVEIVPAEEEPFAAGRAVHRSADGTVWIGHYERGLVRYKDGTFGQVSRGDGLWDEGASTILEDAAGNLWMSGNRGVHRATLAELNAFLDGEIDRIRGRGYGADAGFRNPETSGFNGFRDAAGRMWFPTFSGVAVLDPEAVLALEQAPPRIRIRSVSTETERFEPATLLALPLGQRRLDVQYGAVLLSGHDGLHYEVQIEGVDAGWVDVGGQRQVTYGSLPPGHHLFRVRAISGAGVPGLEEASIAVTVPPYFHETGAFTLLLVMMAGGAFWLLYHLRVRQLSQRAVTLGRMVDERTRELARSKEETEVALETVEAQAAELRSLDEAKSRFFANVSHELRTPLALVQGPLQDVLDGRLGPTPEPVREQVETVLASGRRLGELVEQLLDVAKLESRELRLNVRREDLAPLFDRLARAFDALARSQGIAFEARVPEGAVVATVDADQMEKVWANLLSNALKFTPEGGRVAFTVEAGGSSDLVVTVEDDGPGIPEDELEHIFERFHQIDASPKRAHGGTGLGLALVREITELHAGTVEVRSELGRGSRFVARVPADAAVEPARAPYRTAPVDAPVRADSPIVRPDKDDTERRTILVVEDNAELRAYLRRHLADRYRVVEAANGREGLDQARAQVPDLILCDIMMPEMDGEELCRAVRADPELAYLPVVMLTARASRESRLSALEGGADDYLVKPFDPAELELRVRNLFAARQRLAERVRDAGGSLPFVPLERPGNGTGHDFATDLEAVLRRGMADEDFGVDDIAKGMVMSRATLYRKADEALGASPMELLWGYRLDQAAHWLRETDATVSEVAYGSGFKTVPHFTRRFKERFATTPAAWREGG